VDGGGARPLYPLIEDLTVRLHRSGVLITAGTDMMNPWMTPGTSYHRELQLLSDAGLAPGEVLQVATANGAAAMDLDAEIGTLDEGKVADRVVLDADPMESVENLGAIRLVFLRGQSLIPSELLGRWAAAGHRSRRSPCGPYYHIYGTMAQSEDSVP